MFEFYLQNDHSKECIKFLNNNSNLSPNKNYKEYEVNKSLLKDNNIKEVDIKSYALGEFNDILKKYIIENKNKSITPKKIEIYSKKILL